MRGWIVVVAALLAGGGCTAAEPAAMAPVPRSEPAGDEFRAGTLRTDQITVELRDHDVHVRVTPLAPEVLELTAPDTRHRLLALERSARRVLADEPTPVSEPMLFLVSFRSTAADAAFDPESLTIEATGQRLRACRIHPLTPGWGEQRLRPGAAESAVYVFEAAFPMLQPFTVRYGAQRSDRWRTVLPLLDAARRRRF